MIVNGKKADKCEIFLRLDQELIERAIREAAANKAKHEEAKRKKKGA